MIICMAYCSLKSAILFLIEEREPFLCLNIEREGVSLQVRPRGDEGGLVSQTSGCSVGLHVVRYIIGVDMGSWWG